MSVAAHALVGAAFAQLPAKSRLTSQRAEGAESCPGEAELRAAVSARLGYDAFAVDAPTETQVTWWRDAGGTLSARVVRTGEGGASLGARTLESGADDCAELASATAFAIAVAIDPTAATREPVAIAAPPAPPPPAPPAVAPPAVVQPPALAATPPNRNATPPRSSEPTRITPFIGASAHLALLAAPDVAAGGAIHAGVRVGWISIAAEGRFDAEARGADEGAPGEVGSRLAFGALVPCGHLGPAAFCGVAALGALEVQGYGVDDPQSDGTIIAAFGPRVGVELPVVASRLGLFVQGDALFTLPRATVELDDLPAYRQTVAHLVLAGGFRLHLGELAKSDAP